MPDEDIGWHRTVFLESTALFRLGSRLENVDFAELLRLRDLLKFELKVAEVSWREYLRRREKEVRDVVAKIRQCKADLAKHDQPCTELAEAESKALTHFQNIPEHFSAKARALGINVVSTVALDPRELLDMSLANDAPFEDSQSDSGEKTKEKGFRDALIMFTILRDIENKPDDNVLIVTDDRRLSDGLRFQAEKRRLNLEIVEDLQQATSHIDARLNTWYRGLIKREADEAKTMLLTYREKLAESVKQVRELTDWDLGQGPLAGLGGEEREHLNIQELRSLQFDDVESALWKKGADKQKSTILFKIRCTAHVIATAQSLLLFDPTKFTVGGGQAIRQFRDLSITPVEKAVPIRLYGEAQFASTNGGWQLVNIKVDKSLPEPEWKELWKHEIQMK